MKEISIEEFSKLNKDDYVLIDVRDEGLRHYGTIPGAIAIEIDDEIEAVNKKIEELPKNKKQHLSQMGNTKILSEEFKNLKYYVIIFNNDKHPKIIIPLGYFKNPKIN